MTNRTPFVFLIVLLILSGLSAAAYLHNEYDIPWLPTADALIWQIEARIELQTGGGPSQVFLTLPPEQPGFKLLNEAAASPGWGFAAETTTEQRRAHWSRRASSGEQILFYKLDYVADEGTAMARPAGAPRSAHWDGPYATAARQLLDIVLPLSADAHSLTVQLIKLVNQSDQNANLLATRYARPELVARFLLSSGHHARSVEVLELEDGRRRLQLQTYVQVWDGERWRLYDPETGEAPADEPRLLWQTGAPAVLEVQGGSRSRVTFSVSSQTRSGLLVAQEGAGDLALSLYNLPIAEQGMFKLIMLLPVGALVVVLMRILIGIRTSGTFMPVLIALAFLQTELLPGLLSFMIVICLGLFIRSYLSSLNLLLVARIATLVILVIALVSVFSIVSYRLGLIQGLSITFFPMIILAWTIERMSIVWEEEGPREVFVQGSGSLFVAVLAFLLMDLALVEHLAFNFPELHLVVLAVILLVGRYTGYRLLELQRFAEFNRST